VPRQLIGARELLAAVLPAASERPLTWKQQGQCVSFSTTRASPMARHT
jgi:hypothetical protein